ncbi:STAS-like domain-containing protein [Aurantiacibacter flavus]|uniref:STAS-like domain-containing protein n=1 Tax=Aurantiacibacter flavus TaxID=3145232 RepID=A0ABV0CTJ1_9SPHN
MTTFIDIGRQFSRHPAGRFPSDGKYNGESFRKKFLVTPLNVGENISIIFDNAIDYGSSFLEEAFGGLIRIEGFSRDQVLNLITLETSDDFLRYEVLEYINSAESTGRN